MTQKFERVDLGSTPGVKSPATFQVEGMMGHLFADGEVTFTAGGFDPDEPQVILHLYAPTNRRVNLPRFCGPVVLTVTVEPVSKAVVKTPQYKEPPKPRLVGENGELVDDDF